MSELRNKNIKRKIQRLIRELEGDRSQETKMEDRKEAVLGLRNIGLSDKDSRKIVIHLCRKKQYKNSADLIKDCLKCL